MNKIDYYAERVLSIMEIKQTDLNTQAMRNCVRIMLKETTIEVFKDIRETIKGTGCKEAEDGSVLDIETYDIDAKEFIKKEKEWLGD